MHMLDVKSLTFTYPGAVAPTLKGIDFHIDQGEIFGFLGPSGAGKSTTQRILMGILKQYGGQVTVMGRPLHQASTSYYERIGVAFEFPNFYSRFTALENLSLFRSLYSGKTEEPMMLLTKLGLEDAANRRVSDYSKGMKMRLNLCRALLHKPDILFLDEPTSGLDPVNTKLVKELLLEQKREGKTILISTHNMHIAEELCERVAFVVDGTIPLIDSPRNLMLRGGSKKVRVEYKEEPGKRCSADFELAGLARNEQFQKLLQGNTIETMHTLEASLEDIFVQTTGRQLTCESPAL